MTKLANVGYIILKVNARCWEDAVITATDASSDCFFHRSGELSEGESPPETGKPEGEDGCGAWTIRVERLGFVSESGKEFSSEYVATEGRFEGELPWEDAHAASPETDWEGLRRSLLEREALSENTQEAQKVGRPRI